MDIAQIVTLSLIIVFAIILAILGFQMFFVLKDLRKTMFRLNRLFDDAVRIDWPTAEHDYRRTSATLLKGDMNSADDVEKTAFVIASGVTKEQVVKPLVADIDGNEAMDTVTFVHDTTFTNKTEIYGVELGKKDKNIFSKPKTKKKWVQVAYGGAVYFPGTLANLDGDIQKELVAGVRNGTVYILNENSVLEVDKDWL